MGYIYITTNIVNKKQYIGYHDGLETDTYLGSGTAIKNALKKYGKENFVKEIIQSCTLNESTELETKYITEYNTIRPNGYNISPTGGFMRPGGKHDENTKEKIKKTTLKNWGQRNKNEFKKLMSERMKEYYKTNPGTKISKKQIMINKYGEVDGLKKYNEWRQKIYESRWKK
jgi:group I intron endonuclease